MSFKFGLLLLSILYCGMLVYVWAIHLQWWVLGLSVIGFLLLCAAWYNEGLREGKRIGQYMGEARQRIRDEDIKDEGNSERN